jgi:hypothetical protein
MTAQTEKTAFEIIRQRQLDMILICPKSVEDIFRHESEEISTFYQRLQEDTPPEGIKKVTLPENLADDFMMFKVVQ